MSNKIKFKPLTDRGDIVEITCGKFLPIKTINNTFNKLLIKYKMMGYTCFEDFSVSEIHNIMDKLCELIGYIGKMGYTLYTKSLEDETYLCFDIPIRFIFGKGYTIQVENKRVDNSEYLSKSFLERNGERVCCLCNTLDSTESNFLNIALDFNGNIGFLYEKVSYNIYMLNSVDRVEYKFVRIYPA